MSASETASSANHTAVERSPGGRLGSCPNRCATPPAPRGRRSARRARPRSRARRPPGSGPCRRGPPARPRSSGRCSRPPDGRTRAPTGGAPPPARDGPRSGRSRPGSRVTSPATVAARGRRRSSRARSTVACASSERPTAVSILASSSRIRARASRSSRSRARVPSRRARPSSSGTTPVVQGVRDQRRGLRGRVAAAARERVAQGALGGIQHRRRVPLDPMDRGEIARAWARFPSSPASSSRRSIVPPPCGACRSASRRGVGSAASPAGGGRARSADSRRPGRARRGARRPAPRTARLTGEEQGVVKIGQDVRRSGWAAGSRSGPLQEPGGGAHVAAAAARPAAAARCAPPRVPRHRRSRSPRSTAAWWACSRWKPIRSSRVSPSGSRPSLSAAAVCSLTRTDFRDRLVRLARQRVTEAESLVRRLGVRHDEVALCEIVEHRGDVDPVVVGQERCDVAGRERQAEDRGAFEDLAGTRFEPVDPRGQQRGDVGGIAMPASCSDPGRDDRPFLLEHRDDLLEEERVAVGDVRDRVLHGRGDLGQQGDERALGSGSAASGSSCIVTAPGVLPHVGSAFSGSGLARQSRRIRASRASRDVLEHREQGRRRPARRRRPAGGRRRAIVSRQIRIDQTVPPGWCFAGQAERPHDAGRGEPPSG